MNALILYCDYYNSDNFHFLNTPPINEDGKIYYALEISFEGGSDYHRCMSKFFDFDNAENYLECPRVRRDPGVYIPFTLDQLKSLHNLETVTETELEYLLDTYDSKSDFLTQLETYAIAHNIIN